MPDSLTLESPSASRASGRVCTVHDLPWMLSLGHRRYSKTFDPGMMLAWLLRVLNAPDALALRTDGAGCVAVQHSPPWWPSERECHIVVLVADTGCHWQAVTLLRETVTWARSRGCGRWMLWSETDKDLAMLARRIGAVPGPVRYQIDLRE